MQLWDVGNRQIVMFYDIRRGGIHTRVCDLLSAWSSIELNEIEVRDSFGGGDVG